MEVFHFEAKFDIAVGLHIRSWINFSLETEKSERNFKVNLQTGFLKEAGVLRPVAFVIRQMSKDGTVTNKESDSYANDLGGVKCFEIFDEILI